MNYSDGLYQLINSLTKTEKRYFRLFAKTNKSESNLLKLFDAITVKGLKNDTRLKEYFKGHSFTNHFDVMKVHLQKLILQSMRLYYQNSNKEREVRDMIIDIQFLLNKSLYGQCAKWIKKSRAIAITNHYTTAMLEILELEKKLLLVGSAGDPDEKKLKEIYKEESQLLKKLNKDFANKAQRI